MRSEDRIAVAVFKAPGAHENDRIIIEHDADGLAVGIAQDGHEITIGSSVLPYVIAHLQAIHRSTAGKLKVEVSHEHNDPDLTDLSWAGAP